jgi:hypothetical protein
VKAEGLYRLCVYAFNRWSAGEPVRKLQVPHDRPKAI